LVLSPLVFWGVLERILWLTGFGNLKDCAPFASQHSPGLAKLLPDDVKRRADPQRGWLTANECAKQIGWNDWSKHQVLESLQINVPPFSYLEGWTNQAVRNLAAALNLDPIDSTAHFYLGVVLFEQKKNSAASEQFQEAMRFNPQNTAAQEYLNRIQKNHPAGSQP